MESILNEIAESIVKMDDEIIESLVRKAINENIPSTDIYIKGLNEGMIRVVDLYEKGEYYVPETIVCADTLYKGIDTLKKYSNTKFVPKGKVIIAVVEGDTHDIGKNIVGIMLEAAGYEIIDLGANVSLDYICKKAIECNCDIVALSSMMTTTMKGMKKVICDLKEVKNKPYIIIGGAPVSERYAKEINADGYSENAPEAVRLCNRLLNIK